MPDRKDAILFCSLAIGGTWVAFFAALIPNSLILSRYGTIVLICVSVAVAIAAVLEVYLYFALPRKLYTSKNYRIAIVDGRPEFVEVTESETGQIQSQPQATMVGESILSVEALPHMKGYPLPPAVRTDIHEAEQYATIEMKNDGLGTAPVLDKLAKSQWIAGYQSDFPNNISAHEAYLRKIKWEDYPWKGLIAKFGAFRVSSKIGDVVGCRAEAKVKLIELAGRDYRANLGALGYLNWFSPALKNEISKHRGEIFSQWENISGNINRFLTNPEEDILQGQSKDLLGFYMVKDKESVFLCTESETALVGTVHEGPSHSKTLRFEMEITLSAPNYRTSTWRYLITVKDFDDYKIVKK